MKIISKLSTDYELYGSSITYYKSNKNEEFLLNIIKEKGIIDIYELNNYQIIFSLEEEINDELKKGYFFTYKNKLMVLISCTSKVLIYDVNNNQLITSISRGVDNKGTSDSIFCDKNNSVYIIINMNNNLSSLIYPQCKVYKNYCNYYSEAEFFRYHLNLKIISLIYWLYFIKFYIYLIFILEI